MRKICLAMCVWLLSIPLMAQELPPRDLKPKKPQASFTLTIGGPQQTKVVPVESGTVGKVKIGDLIEIGISPESTYKGPVRWYVPRVPTKMGENEKKRSVYFGTGGKPLTVDVVAWGTQLATDDKGVPLVPAVWEPFIVAEAKLEIEGGGGGGGGGGDDDNNNPPTPTPTNDLEKKILAAWVIDKANGGQLASLGKVADALTEIESALDQKTQKPIPRQLMALFHKKVEDKGVKGSTIPKVRDAIADVMESVISASAWDSNTELGFDSVGQLTGAYRNLAKALRKAQ